jgi:hypothetical protein
MAVRSAKKKAVKKRGVASSKRKGLEIHAEEQKRWRGGAIHIDEKGRIIKVVDKHGTEIRGERERKIKVKTKKKKPVLEFKQRCLYSGSGKCYCT